MLQSYLAVVLELGMVERERLLEVGRPEGGEGAAPHFDEDQGELRRQVDGRAQLALDRLGAEEVEQRPRARQTLQAGVHEARVAQIAQAAHPRRRRQTCVHTHSISSSTSSLRKTATRTHSPRYQSASSLNSTTSK